MKKVKKAVNVDEVPEEVVASVGTAAAEGGEEKNASDLENEEDLKLEEQIKDALHAEKLIEKK